jgi:methylenetetrahydrofolate reductase (NADPH)
MSAPGECRASHEKVTYVDVSHQNPLQVQQQLYRAGSIEMLPSGLHDVDAIARELRQGTSVFVTHLQRYPLETSLAALERLHALGLRPVPHIAARRIASVGLLSEFLRQAVSRCGVREALVVGGEADQPVGPFPDALSLLETGLLRDNGLESVSFAAYPNGHPKIRASRLLAALNKKLACAESHGLKAGLVTQFSFSAAHIAMCVPELRSQYSKIPIRIGVPGPTTMLTLLKYAQLCGVPAASKFVGSNAADALRLTSGADPADVITSIAEELRAIGQTNDVSIHLFSFGGAQRTASWLRRAMANT